MVEQPLQIGVIGACGQGSAGGVGPRNIGPGFVLVVIPHPVLIHCSWVGRRGEQGGFACWASKALTWSSRHGHFGHGRPEPRLHGNPPNASLQWAFHAVMDVEHAGAVRLHVAVEVGRHPFDEPFVHQHGSCRGEARPHRLRQTTDVHPP